MGRDQFTQRMDAVSRNKCAEFSGRKDFVLIEQEYPVLVTADDRLKQNRIVESRDLVHVSGERTQIGQGLGKVAARAIKRFGESTMVQLGKIRRGVGSLMAGRSMCELPFVQEEISAA